MEDVLAALAGGQTLAELLQQCADAVVRGLDAAFARIWLLDDDLGELVLHASAGMYTHVDGGHARIPVGAYKIGRIAEERQPHLTNDVGRDPRISDPEWAAREGMVAFAGYPMLAEDRLVGVVGAFARHELSADALDAMAVVADSLALGVLRREAEEQLREERETTATLHRIATALARELDLQRVLQMVTDEATQLSGGAFGAFFYNVENDAGESYMLYTLSGAPVAAFEQFPLPRATPIFQPTFRGERVVREDDVTAAPAYGHNPPHHGMPAGHLPVRSYLAVPVIGRSGDVLGGLFFGHPDAAVFDARAEELIVGVASHAAIAVENARQYERERTAALTLQNSLLPAALPFVEGVELATAYFPANTHRAVGGDWYDAFLLPSGHLAVSVGDVVGHDLQAAAAMGQVRNAVRFAALDAEGAAAVVSRVDRFLTAAGQSAVATMVHAHFDPATRTLDLARAGHPPALIVSMDGTSRFVDGTKVPLLGVDLVGRAPPTAACPTRLAPGDALVLYTDGLIERRGTTLDDGLFRLRKLAEGAAGLPPGELCRTLVSGLVGGCQEDDIALLALRVE